MISFRKLRRSGSNSKKVRMGGSALGVLIPAHELNRCATGRIKIWIRSFSFQSKSEVDAGFQLREIVDLFCAFYLAGLISGQVNKIDWLQFQFTQGDDRNNCIEAVGDAELK